MHYYYGNFSFLDFLLPILFWLLLIWLIGSAISWFLRQRTTEKEYQDNRAMQIARERYAKGEITKKEYEELKRDLA